VSDLFSYADQHPGLADGHAGAKRAAEHAGEDWGKRAYAAFIAHARLHATFTTEDVRLAFTDLPAPAEPRAWGQVALRAKRDHIVIAGDMVRAKNRAVHGQMIRQWRSLVMR